MQTGRNMEFRTSNERQRIFLFLPLLLACATTLAQSALANQPAAVATNISFRNDVMAVLSKAGCNAGTCHGNKSGKGGFKLSLRGQDPDIDYLTLTRDLLARRANPLAAEQSLVLLKPTTQVAHEGGLRFKKDSPEYEILGRWIADGMPDDLSAAPQLQRLQIMPNEQVLVEPLSEVQLQVRAFFSDATTRDVTSLAVYQPANSLAEVS